ncbi:MAG: hypothetical protein NTZ05_10715 [Chloroflexi bacterium]|nr:hypothetical protein [Chloroflexota bacterium]
MSEEAAAAMAAGQRAALSGWWDGAVERFTEAWLLGDERAALALCRARLSLVREMAPDPLEPPAGAVARYAAQVLRLDAALKAAEPEDREQELWLADAAVETRRRVFDQLRFARQRAEGPRRSEALHTLSELFQMGAPPDPAPDGRYYGWVLALTPGYGLDGLVHAAAGRWMPWKGKIFSAAQGQGENVFSTLTRPMTRVLWPGYLGVSDDGPGAYRAFQFRTWSGPSLADPAVSALKIDYSVPGNPRLLRRVLDEVVQLGDGVLLGQAHLHDLPGQWRTAAWFALRPE